MIPQTRHGIGRVAAAILFVAIVALAGIVTSSYLGASTTGTRTSTTNTITTGLSTSTSELSTTPTAVENPSCGTGPAYGDEWLTFKHDSQRTGYSSYNFSASAAGRFTGQLVWQYKDGFSEMAATQTELFVASYWLYAVNISSGAGLWTETTGAGPAPPIASDGTTVYLGANTGGLYAFNSSTGASKPIGDVMTLGTVAICGDVAYVDSGPGQFQTKPSDSLQALNLTSGQTIWSVNLSNGYFIGYPTTDGHTLYMLMDNGTVFAYSANSGSLVWRQTIPLVPVTTVTTVTGSNGGETVIANPGAGDDFVGTPPLAGDELYVTTTFGMMYALNATTGDISWSSNLGTTVVDGRGSSAAAYGMVFEGTAAGLLAVNATDGSVVWKAPLNSTDTGTPTVVDGSVFIADFSGTLYQFNASTGALLWSFSGLGQGYVSEPIVAGGLVAVDGNHGVFAFR